MSISIHFSKAKKASEIRSGLELHIERQPEDVEKVSAETESYIDGSQTQFNQTLFRSERLDGRRFGSVIREERDALLANWTGRKRQKNATDAVVATLQISDESLELMGYEKHKDGKDGKPIVKPWSEQTPEARERVTRAYQAMVEEVCSDRWRYGDVLLCQLHVDESTPHVEVVSMLIDRDDKSFKRGRILNGDGTGVQGRPRSSQTQTVFADGARRRLGKEFSDAYKIERGEPAELRGRKQATAKEIERRAEKKVDEAKALRADAERQAEELQTQLVAIDQRRREVDKLKEKYEKEHAERLSALKSSETALKSRISDFENERSKTIAELKQRENELNRRSVEQDKRDERFEKMKVDLTDEVRQKVQRELIGDKGMTVVKTLKQMNLDYDFANKRSISDLDRLYDELKSSKSSLFLSSMVDVNEKVMTATSEDSFEIDFDL